MSCRVHEKQFFGYEIELLYTDLVTTQKYLIIIQNGGCEQDLNIVVKQSAAFCHSYYVNSSWKPNYIYIFFYIQHEASPHKCCFLRTLEAQSFTLNGPSVTSSVDKRKNNFENRNFECWNKILKIIIHSFIHSRPYFEIYFSCIRYHASTSQSSPLYMTF